MLKYSVVPASPINQLPADGSSNIVEFLTIDQKKAVILTCFYVLMCSLLYFPLWTVCPSLTYLTEMCPHPT